MTCLELTRDEVAAELAASPLFPSGVVVIGVEPKSIIAKIDEALSTLGLAIHVLPPEPMQALETEGEPIIFFPVVELRVRVLERFELNSMPMRSRGARDAVMVLLQGFEPSTADKPLSLAPRPQAKAEYPGQVIYDVIFHFASHLNSPE